MGVNVNMNLDPNCTKAILQYILDILGGRNELISVNTIVSHFKNEYSEDTILAHIKEIYIKSLVNGATYASNRICSLETVSDRGLEYLKS